MLWIGILFAYFIFALLIGEIFTLLINSQNLRKENCMKKVCTFILMTLVSFVMLNAIENSTIYSDYSLFEVNDVNHHILRLLLNLMTIKLRKSLRMVLSLLKLHILMQDTQLKQDILNYRYFL